MFIPDFRWSPFPLRTEILQVEALALVVIQVVVLLGLRPFILNKLPSFFMRKGTLFISAIIIACAGTLLTLQIGSEHVVLSFAILAGFAFSFLDSTYALCFFLALLFIRPWEATNGGTWLSAIPKASAMVVLTSALLDTNRPRKFRVYFSKTSLFGIALYLWLGASMIIMGMMPFNSWHYNDIFTKAVIVHFFILNFIQNSSGLKRTVQTITLSLLTIAILAVMNISFNPVDPSVNTRLEAMGPISNSNDIAAVLVLVLPFLLSIFSSSTEKRAEEYNQETVSQISSSSFINLKMILTSSRVLFLILSVSFTVWVIYKTQSRGALLGLAAIAGTWVLLRFGNRMPWLKVLIPLGVAGLMVLVLNTRLGRSGDDIDASTSSRMNYWKTGVIMAVRNPVFGVGYGGFPLKYEEYAPTIEHEWGQRTIHSSWLLVLAEGGFPALFFLIGFFLMTLKSALKISKEHPEYLYSLMGYGVCMSFLSHTYTLYPWILFAITLTAERIYTSEKIKASASGLVHAPADSRQ